MEKMRKLMWGFCFIIVGVILGLNSLGITNITIFFKGWWTLFIIVPCFIGLFDEKEKLGNVIGLIIGFALLFASLELISFSTILKLIWPVLLITIGINILIKGFFKSDIDKKFKTIDTKDLDSVTATFAEQKIKAEKDYEGGNIEAIFGSVDLDLTKSNLKKETMIKVTTIFGGVNITVPDDVNVLVKSTPIFGGVSNKIRNNENNTKTLYIDAVCVFGGIDIK